MLVPVAGAMRGELGAGGARAGGDGDEEGAVDTTIVLRWARVRVDTRTVWTSKGAKLRRHLERVLKMLGLVFVLWPIR